MSANPDVRINEPLYDWCVRAFSLLHRRFGMKISIHAEDSLLDSGQIFQFNHFARFETIIPQYFIYQATGAYCRCVADQALFAGNDRFAKFLWGVGAVPSNYPGLLPFLAAEILRGRKVIIFPEGSMIKDRQIAVAPTPAFLPSTSPSSAHRQGAAALAVVLEIFKKRILSVHEEGDAPRLDRWVAALGLSGQQALIEAAQKPTFIVPSNITFFPLRTGDNILRKAAEYFDLGQRGTEEMLVEGNLLLRDTDMDIRFGKAFHPDVAWNVADRLMLNRSFERIESLDDLFGLKNAPNRWIERMLAGTMGRTTRRLRDICMEEMYANVTVNLNHLMSRLIVRVMQSGDNEIEKSKFHSLLYRIVKDVQKLPGIHLHRTLQDPECYDGIHTGSNKLLTQFFDTAVTSSLIDVTETHYRLLPALRGGDGRRDPRLENVIRVYANEIALLAPVIRVIEGAAIAAPAELARMLFDDEMRVFDICKKRFAQAHHAAINDQETATEPGHPYLIIPEKPTRPGVVLIHGFLASPAEFKAISHDLAGLGHPVLGVRLKGHGTSPWDLHERSWEDWLASVQRGHEIMSLLAKDVVLAGFATGASLALHCAAANPDGVSGVVTVSAPLKFRYRTMRFAPLVHGINKLSKWVFVQQGVKPFQASDAENPHIGYRNMPVRGLVELLKVAEELDRRLPEVTCPVAIVQVTDDPMVDPASAQAIHEKLGSIEKSLHMIASDRHSILPGNVAGSRALVAELIAAMVPPPDEATPAVQQLDFIFSAALRRVLGPFIRRYGKGGRKPTAMESVSSDTV